LTAAKGVNTKIYKTIILPVVLYGCETWSMTLWKEYRLRVWIRYSSVSIVTSYSLTAGVQLPAGARDSLLLCNVQTSPAAYPTSYPMAGMVTGKRLDEVYKSFQCISVPLALMNWTPTGLLVNLLQAIIFNWEGTGHGFCQCTVLALVWRKLRKASISAGEPQFKTVTFKIKVRCIA
jgi:hypothetical protein